MKFCRNANFLVLVWSQMYSVNFMSMMLCRYACFAGDVGIVSRIVLVRMMILQAQSCVITAVKLGIHLLNVPNHFKKVGHISY